MPITLRFNKGYQKSELAPVSLHLLGSIFLVTRSQTRSFVNLRKSLNLCHYVVLYLPLRCIVNHKDKNLLKQFTKVDIDASNKPMGPRCKALDRSRRYLPISDVSIQH